MLQTFVVVELLLPELRPMWSVSRHSPQRVQGGRLPGGAAAAKKTRDPAMTIGGARSQVQLACAVTTYSLVQLIPTVVAQDQSDMVSHTFEVMLKLCHNVCNQLNYLVTARPNELVP